LSSFFRTFRAIFSNIFVFGAESGIVFITFHMSATYRTEPVRRCED
jgi:hypothetical protein